MERELKITDPGLVFHSFRHAFKRFSRDAEINTKIHDLLTGHSSGTVGSTYGQGASIKTLKAAIEKIRFAELMPPLRPGGAAQDRSRGAKSRARSVLWCRGPVAGIWPPSPPPAPIRPTDVPPDGVEWPVPTP